MTDYSNFTNILHAISLLDKLSDINIDKINYWEMQFIKNINDTLNNISKNLDYGKSNIELDNVLNKYINYYSILIQNKINKINNQEFKNLTKTLNKIKNTTSETVEKKNQYYEYDTINNIDGKCYLDTCNDIQEQKSYYTKLGRKCKKINYKV
uniref:Uncharacterized protein n=1 Tax=viral metagenome TaxID=1070528 RepID=A0A6C0IVZ8_9ZZZZ